MKAFLDFEASSLSDQSYPIEVAWVFEDGRAEAHMIAPGPGWIDWSEASEAIHGISRPALSAEGRPFAFVASRMVEALSGHDLFASAPSWDGKWLSFLLRQAGFARHTLRLRDTDDAVRWTVAEILDPVLPSNAVSMEVERILKEVKTAKSGNPAHRALADAVGEHHMWLHATQAARAIVQGAA